jgi:hypothetical protein
VVSISRSAFPAASSLVFRVERTSPDANHITFNKESIVILAPGAQHETEKQNYADSGQEASKFYSTGDLIDTWSWLRDDALQQSAE